MVKERWVGALAGAIVVLGLFPARGKAPSQGPPVSPPTVPARFATPRETLKTLYFSVLAYDFRAALIDDAFACLDEGGDGTRDFAEMARLAVELDAVLREISLGVNEVP